MSSFLYNKNCRPIFLFHRVFPQRDIMWDPTDPALFERVLQFLEKHFIVLPLHKLINAPQKKYPKPLASITFDDGYRDFIDHALPLLEKYGFSSTMFIATECIDKQQPIWTYLVDELFLRTNKMQLDANTMVDLPAHFHKTKWDNNTEKLAYGKQLKRYLKLIPAYTRIKLIERLKTAFNDVEPNGNLMMNWEDVKHINSQGVQLGAHSVTHPTMDTLQTDEEIVFELVQSAKRIKEEVGINPAYFSYPNGSYNNNIQQLTEAAGYTAAFAVGQQPYNTTSDNKFAIPRIEIYNGNWPKTLFRLSGAFSVYNKIMNK